MLLGNSTLLHLMPSFRRSFRNYCLYFCFKHIFPTFCQRKLNWAGTLTTSNSFTLCMYVCIKFFVFLYSSWGSHGKYTGVVYHSLLQWIMFCQNLPLWPIHLGSLDMAWLIVSLSYAGYISDTWPGSDLWRCLLSPCFFNLYAEHIMRNAGLDELQAEIKMGGRNINNVRYADDTTLMAEREKELKNLLIRVEESETAGLKLNIKKKLRLWLPALLLLAK